MSEDESLKKKVQEWQENAKHLYEKLDMVHLEWPSLSLQWSFDDKKGSRALTSSFSKGTEAGFIAEVEVTSDKPAWKENQLKKWPLPKLVDENSPTYPAVLRIRQSPIDADVYACTTEGESAILLYKKSEDQCVAQYKNSPSEGFGLAWSPTEFAVAIASGDGEISVWRGENATSMKSTQTLKVDCEVNDLTWDHEQAIVVALEDGHVLILNANLEVLHNIVCHSSGVNAAALSPKAPHLLATASTDGTWRLFDLRAPNAPLYENSAHENAINSLKWSPHIDGVLATSGMDSIVYLWDIRQIGRDQAYEDVGDGGPELIFKHNGHLDGGQVPEIDWHRDVPLLLLSSDEHNIMMAWKPREDALWEKTEEVPKMPSFLL